MGSKRAVIYTVAMLDGGEDRKPIEIWEEWQSG